MKWKLQLFRITRKKVGKFSISHARERETIFTSKLRDINNVIYCTRTTISNESEKKNIQLQTL